MSGPSLRPGREIRSGRDLLVQGDGLGEGGPPPGMRLRRSLGIRVSGWSSPRTDHDRAGPARTGRWRGRVAHLPVCACEVVARAGVSGVVARDQVRSVRTARYHRSDGLGDPPPGMHLHEVVARARVSEVVLTCLGAVSPGLLVRGWWPRRDDQRTRTCACEVVWELVLGWSSPRMPDAVGQDLLVQN